METLRKLSHYDYLVIIAALGVLYYLGSGFVDPDFGYRLLNGEFVFNDGLSYLKSTDPYSYTMTSYRFIEHSWLTALIFYLLFQFIGYNGLLLVWSMVAVSVLTLTVVFGSNFLKEGLIYKNVLFYLILGILITTFGVRVQVVSWLGLSFLSLVIFKREYWDRYKYFLPAVFLVWANLHGSFIAGIMFLGLWTVVDTFEFGELSKSKSVGGFIRNLHRIRFSNIDLESYTILFFSVLATLVNPYGSGVWIKAGTAISSSDLRSEIQEWMPSFFGMRFTGAFYLALSVVFVLKNYRRFGLSKIIVYLVLLLQGLLSSRNYPIYALTTLPLVSQGVKFFYNDVKKVKHGRKRARKVYVLILAISIVILSVEVVIRVKPIISGLNFYPDGAINYLNENTPEGNVFSIYGWGGYINWKMPKKKVFVNGGMPIWNREEEVEGESKNAFKDYLAITKGELDYRIEFEKYNVDTVLWPKQDKPSRLESLLLRLIGRYSETENMFSLAKELKKDGWKEVYRGKVGIVYQKPES